MPSPATLSETFWQRKPLVGMVHLPPLPGSPLYQGEPMERLLERAAADAAALASGGADAIMVENFFDVPFAKERVPPHTLVAMTRAVQMVRETVALPLGVNVLRNDSCAALAIAHLCGAQFIRVNVYVGAAITDQGILEGSARQVVLYRKELGAQVAIWADVFVKHAAPLGTGTLEDAARDAALRGLADALILSGAATGAPASPQDIQRVRSVLPEARLLIGSGLTAENARELLREADGAIVGTSLKQEGNVALPVDPARVAALRAAINAALPPS
jgi:membrane complex biogenesis BtpA family protein